MESGQIALTAADVEESVCEISLLEIRWQDMNRSEYSLRSSILCQVDLILRTYGTDSEKD